MGLVVLVTILASSHHSSKLADAETTDSAKRELASDSGNLESQSEKSDLQTEGVKKLSPLHKKMNSIKKAQK